MSTPTRPAGAAAAGAFAVAWLLAAAAPPVASADSVAVSRTYVVTCANGSTVWTAPAGVTSVRVDATGGQGDTSTLGQPGGRAWRSRRRGNRLDQRSASSTPPRPYLRCVDDPTS